MRIDEQSDNGKEKGVHLSIVIPAYNEERRIAHSLERIVEYFRPKGVAYEIVVVDDASSDRTPEILKRYCASHSQIVSLRNVKNMGKGFTTRRGMLSARGDLILFTDTDLSVPIEELDRLLIYARDGFDIVFGSRYMPDSRIVSQQTWHRRKLGRVFNYLTRFLILPQFRDTQCGFKLFRRDTAQHLFKEQKLDGYAFDVEILYLASRSGYRIKEVGVTWFDAPFTKIRVFRDSVRMLSDIMKIKRMHH